MKKLTTHNLSQLSIILKNIDIIIKTLDLPKNKWSKVGVEIWTKGKLRDGLRVFIDGELNLKLKKWWEFWK